MDELASELAIVQANKTTHVQTIQHHVTVRNALSRAPLGGKAVARWRNLLSFLEDGWGFRGGPEDGWVVRLLPPHGSLCTKPHILTTDQSDAGSAGIFSRRTNQTREVQ
eukprot:5112967-Pyramimonas_sp.AAC.1